MANRDEILKEIASCKLRLAELGNALALINIEAHKAKAREINENNARYSEQIRLYGKSALRYRTPITKT